jgi:peptidoglycan LD-endopeptidase CwlK
MGVGSGGGGGVGSGGNGGVGSGGGGGGVGSGGGGGGVGSGGPGGVSSDQFAVARVVIPDPSMRRTDLGALHPILRESVAQLLASFQQENLPLQLYEGFRTPQRQAWLYQQGRTFGSIITESDAWESYHQYGLAADFVLWVNGAWSWSTLGVNESRWKRLRELGKSVGLEPRAAELPHLQVSGLDLKNLKAGKFPPDGDDSWQDNLEAAAISWTGKSPAPPVASSRPALNPPPRVRKR